MKSKEFLVIRCRGYYVNIILNDPDVRHNWMENNLPRADLKGMPDKDGLVPEKSLFCAMRDGCVSFTPASAEEAFNARLFDPAMKHRCGLIR